MHAVMVALEIEGFMFFNINSPSCIYYLLLFGILLYKYATSLFLSVWVEVEQGNGWQNNV